MRIYWNWNIQCDWLNEVRIDEGIRFLFQIYVINNYDLHIISLNCQIKYLLGLPYHSPVQLRAQGCSHNLQFLLRYFSLGFYMDLKCFNFLNLFFFLYVSMDYNVLEYVNHSISHSVH